MDCYQITSLIVSAVVGIAIIAQAIFARSLTKFGKRQMEISEAQKDISKVQAQISNLMKRIASFNANLQGIHMAYTIPDVEQRLRFVKDTQKLLAQYKDIWNSADLESIESMLQSLLDGNA